MSKVDLSEFYRYSRPRKKPCMVGFAISQLGDDDVDKLKAALAQDQGLITNAAVVQWLAARDQQVNVSAVVSHRKGTCSCGS